MNEEMKNLSFEQAMKALEDVVARLSDRDTTLDHMIVLYEEGMNFMKLCRVKLAEAETKIEILNSKFAQENLKEGENG
ncbi:MAG: exodeoxyribonuclease VII small subunit [Candidatus Cloacimonadaceae bacterium]|nr:exodeoxyribonuclease VII small subunit [Candidatus Cloacimonadaceae bacterium]MDP3114975.1 exodeoxyribonuclease VII small subunit [Candidatus Cloacimonadaceae bacterium]